MARLRAPTGHGEVLAVPDFAEVPRLVEENRRKLDRDDVRIDGLPLRELRALARREVLELASGRRQPAVPPTNEQPADAGRSPHAPLTHAGRSPHAPLPYADRSPHAPLTYAGRSPHAPLLLAGHQPELSHPGVWVKNFALNGLARKLGAIPFNLIVDTDTLKTTTLRFPVFDGQKAYIESVAFDRLDGAMPYEDRLVIDAEMFRTFADRAAPLWHNWGYEPLLRSVWALASGGHKPPEGSADSEDLRPPLAARIGERFTATRLHYEHQWGCRNLELTVSRLAQTTAFAHFARHVLGDLQRFRTVYNAGIRAYRAANGIRSDNHPAPELAEGEAPFWVRTTTGQRQKATSASGVDHLRPRALTLTLFARVCLGDFFIHGIGGGKYDEVTDTIIRDYFGIDPPTYQVLSATLHLPLPTFPCTADELKQAKQRVRDLHWNPQRYLPPGHTTELVKRKAALAASEPPTADHAARKAWFRELQRVNEKLRPLVVDQFHQAEAELARIRAEVAVNGVLKRRDYSWVLYPEAMLRPFLQQFL